MTIKSNPPFYLDSELAEVYQVMLESANTLERKLERMRVSGNVHAQEMGFTIDLHYGDKQDSDINNPLSIIFDGDHASIQPRPRKDMLNG